MENIDKPYLIRFEAEGKKLDVISSRMRIRFNTDLGQEVLTLSIMDIQKAIVEYVENNYDLGDGVEINLP